MKSIRSVLLFLSVICSFSSFAQSHPVTLTPLDNYFLKHSAHPAKAVMTRVINHDKYFSSNFGIAKTATNKVIKPDFSRQRVLAVMMPATSTSTSVSISKAEQIGSTLNVYFTVQTGEKMSYTIQPLALSAIDKDKSVRRVRFYNGSILFKTVNVGS
jgi:hypothetical protein